MEVNSSSPFTIDIHVQDVTNLIGAEIEFSYDKDLVTFNSVVAGSLLSEAPLNIIIHEHDTEIGKVLLTLAAAHYLEDALSDTEHSSLVQIEFTPLTSGVLELELDFSSDSGSSVSEEDPIICPWHEALEDHSVYILDTAKEITNSFSSLINATIIITI